MKSLLLAKSNLRKNKGLSICISLLILISSLFICVSCLLINDYQKSALNTAKNLNTSDVSLYSYGNSDGIDKAYIDSIIPDTVKEYEYNDILNIQTSIKFNAGEVTPNINIINSSSLKRNLSRVEILEEDSSIVDNYIYVPYHLHSGGGINIGDTYDIKFPSKTYTFNVRGYINPIFAGSYNMNRYEMLVSDEAYDRLLNENPDSKAFDLFLNYHDDVNFNVESNKLSNKIFIDKHVETDSEDLDITLQTRTFISSIFFVSFLLTSLIIILIVTLMIWNNISNYVRENIRSLGALKAIGYTSKDIKKSLILQFGLLTFVGLFLGVILGYFFMPFITNMLVAQSGIPYCVKFNLLSTLMTIFFIPMVVLFIVLLSLRKINKLEPIVALRDGLVAHNFKKNHVPLDKSRFSINTSLSFKGMFKNAKQNIISFVTVLFLCFLMVISMAMYQNFSRDPKLSLLTFEIVDGVISIDKSAKNDFVNDLKSDNDITKYEYLTMYTIQDNDFNPFAAYIMEDPNLINNKDNCYKGRYPKYDNEVAISGKYAKDKGYNIGDKVEFGVGDKKFSYLITGFIQSTNYFGRECLFLEAGAKHIIDVDGLDPTYYFDSDVDASIIIDRYNQKYGDKVLTTLNFEELIKGQMDTFISVANLMVVVISIIVGFIIVLVLYLLMKTLIYNRRYEYGILKAIGFKSRDLIVQNVLSFMPTIVIATLIGTVISYYATNPYIGLMMRSFGIMKCTMVLPMDLLIISVVFIILISLISTILMSLKIKDIEPCDLLIGE